jgi:hypothetical protein
MKGSLAVLRSSIVVFGMLTFFLIIPEGRLESMTTNFSAEPPNLGIASISANKRVVGLNCVMSLGINVTNYGVAAETFNATFYANSSIIHETLNATVDGQNFTIVVFKWTVVGLACGNYSISASITPVINETDLSDNFINDLWIFVTIKGDFNGDKWVDIYDILMFTRAWDWHPVHPCVYPWYPPPINPIVDFNDDGRIDIFEAILLAACYGKHWE